MLAVEVIILLIVATASLLAGRIVGLPPIVSYLAAGVLVGPGGLGLVAHSEALVHLADLGVALLLFGVGIEFSLERLREILARMVASGSAQVALTTAITAVVFQAAGSPWPAAVFTGFLVSLSSTAIVFKLYEEADEIDAPQGLAAAGLLLFQDLALVPMMLLVPVLANPGEGAITRAARALLAAVATVGGLLTLSRLVLPRILLLVARARTQDLFPIVSLVLAFGTALAAQHLGLSLPIGAFLAGLALSGSPYAHGVFAELLPLRDVLVALFFTSMGLLADPAVIAAEPALLAGMLGAVVIKAIIIAVVVGLLWQSWRLALLTGLGLAQLGEFSFVLAREGSMAGLVPRALEQAFLGAAILTMGATPFLMALARTLARRGAAAPASTKPKDLKDHVLVLGYGITGQAVARVLRETGVPFVAVEMVSERVQAGQREGLPVRFGDASRRAVLEGLGGARARAAVVALGDPAASRQCVSLLRQLAPRARILARARHVHEIAELERLGADEVIPSELETSIELFVRLLVHLGVPRHVVRVQESVIRLGHYHALRGIGSTPELLAQTRKLVMGGVLETAQVMDGSTAAGRTLAELDLLRSTRVQVLSVVRDEHPLPTPTGSTALRTGDLVVLYGPHETIDTALRLLEPRDLPTARQREG